MKVTAQQVEKILKEDHNFKQFGLTMMVTRLKGLYAKDPSREVLMKSTNELNAFLDKFNSIMGDDYAIMQKL